MFCFDATRRRFKMGQVGEYGNPDADRLLARKRRLRTLDFEKGARPFETSPGLAASVYGKLETPLTWKSSELPGCFTFDCWVSSSTSP
jgi:hypothetical protein